MNDGRKNVGLIQFVLLICLVNTVICHYVPQDVNNNTEEDLQHHRSRRDLDRDEKICDALGKVDHFGSMISMIPVIGPVYDTAVTVAKFALKQDYMETDCSDLPFEKIKKQIKEIFDKLNEKVERNFVAIHRLYTEIRRLYNEVTLSIKDSRIQPILSGMKMFIEGFNWYQSRIDEYFNDANYVEIESVLEDLRDAVKRIGGQLSIQVNDILNQNFAIPEDGDDNLSILALNALYYGVQAHVSVLLFLLEKRALLAEYYYKSHDFDSYHKQLGMMKAVFSDLKALKSKNNKENLDNKVFGYDLRRKLGQDNSLIDRFYSTAELAVRIIDVQRRDSDKALKDSIHEHIEALKKTDNEISKLVLTIIKETPHLGQITIRNQEAKPPGKLRVVGNKNQVMVTYAMQYKRNSSFYFMVSDWTVSYALGEKKYAEINFPTVADGTSRLIFRQIRSEKRPQLVGIIDNPDETVFKDVHRDVYNAAWTGESSYDITLRAIENGANVDAIFENGRRPLHAAAEDNNVKLAKALIENGGNINVQDENGYTPLHLAAKLGHSEFCQFLISYGVDGTIKSKPEGLTPLHIAVIYKQISSIKVLIQSNKFNVNLGDKNGDTPLHYAVNISQSAVEAMIVNGNVDVNAKNNEGFTPLHFAVANEAENIASKLLSTSRLNVNVLSNNNMSPLHMAVLDSSSPMTKYLLDNAGVDVDIGGPEGLRPIHFAVMTGNKYFTTLLIEKKANLAALSKSKWTPLHFAITLRDVDMINMLLDNRQVKQNINSTTNEGYTALHMAASAFDDHKIALELIEANRADVNAKTNDGFTALHIAAIHNKKAIAYELLRRANIAEKTPDGKSFWELAVAKDSVDVIKLIKMSSAPTEKYHLLDITVKHDSSEVLKYVVEEKNFRCTKEEKLDLLYTSIEYNNTKTSKYIIDIIGAMNYDDLANYRKSYLVTAAKNQNLVIVKYLISRVEGANDYWYHFKNRNFQYVDEHGKTKTRTALHEAVYSGNIPLVKYLLSVHSLFNITDDQGKTAVDVAKETGLQYMYGILKYKDTCTNVGGESIEKIETDFIKSGCYDRITDSYTSPLHYAIFRNPTIAKKLLDNGADVNKLDVNRNTPLHLALQEKIFDLAELIMRNNPDVRIKNNKKEKPIDLAREHGASEELIAKIEKLEHDLNVNDGFVK